uniref:NADH-ubiquinone oxidoreductase chain 1 n=1 Tax=Dicyema misakiense TaxID=10218 RepID=Q9T9L2_9BILA|nr:NADH dehydrogenase subunit I [Dicyema misakiense]
MFMLLAVAFLTLLERKVMGYIHGRVGPNKILLIGVLQPIVDGVKLFLKSHMISVKVLPSVLSLIVPLLLLCVLDVNSSYMLLMYLAVLSLSVWPLLIASWSSYSSYPVLASLRIVAQSISYEVVLYLIFIPLVVLSVSWSGFAPTYSCGIYCVSFVFLGVIVGLSEMHRTPFDFAEGESELVSGYNTEFSSVSFTLLFLAEYLALLVMCVLLSVVMFACWWWSVVFMWVCLSVRFVYVRLRYDQLMQLLWKNLLPTCLCLLAPLFSTLSTL